MPRMVVSTLSAHCYGYGSLKTGCRTDGISGAGLSAYLAQASFCSGREHEGFMTENVLLSIGQVADAANVNVETIRYYQRRGVLEEPAKPLGGHRRYTSEAVNRLRFIKRAQMLGFTLDEVETLLRLDGANTCSDTREIAMHKLALVNTKMADLTAMRDALTALVHQCKIGDHSGSCPIIDALADI